MLGSFPWFSIPLFLLACLFMAAGIGLVDEGKIAIGCGLVLLALIAVFFSLRIGFNLFSPENVSTAPGIDASATCYSGAENVRVFPVIISELKFRDVKRQIFFTDFVERAHNTTLQQRRKFAPMRRKIRSCIGLPMNCKKFSFTNAGFVVVGIRSCGMLIVAMTQTDLRATRSTRL